MITYLDTAQLWAWHNGSSVGHSVYHTVFTARPGSDGRNIIATIALSTNLSKAAFAEIASWAHPFGEVKQAFVYQNSLHARAMNVTFRLWLENGVADAQANIFYVD